MTLLAGLLRVKEYTYQNRYQNRIGRYHKQLFDSFINSSDLF